jgi:hypothetical protein
MIRPYDGFLSEGKIFPYLTKYGKEALEICRPERSPLSLISKKIGNY